MPCCCCCSLCVCVCVFACLLQLIFLTAEDCCQSSRTVCVCDSCVCVPPFDYLLFWTRLSSSFASLPPPVSLDSFRLLSCLCFSSCSPPLVSAGADGERRERGQHTSVIGKSRGKQALLRTREGRTRQKAGSLDDCWRKIAPDSHSPLAFLHDSHDSHTHTHKHIHQRSANAVDFLLTPDSLLAVCVFSLFLSPSWTDFWILSVRSSWNREPGVWLETRKRSRTVAVADMGRRESGSNGLERGSRSGSVVGKRQEDEKETKGSERKKGERR